MENKYRPHEFARRISKSVSTLRRWDKEGRLTAKRTLSQHRYYDDSDIRKALLLPADIPKKIIVSCRVSPKKQQKDLESQLNAMRTFCLARGTAVDEWTTEIAGGTNFKRPKFLALITIYKDKYPPFILHIKTN